MNPRIRTLSFLVSMAGLVTVLGCSGAKPATSASPTTAAAAKAAPAAAPTTAPPKPAAAPATAVPKPAPNGGITFGEPVSFTNSGVSIIGVLVNNTTDQVKSFTVKATYKLGDKIAGTAVGAVNDLRPGEQRAATLISTSALPEKSDSVRLDVDTMVREAKTTDGAETASKVSFGEPKLSGAGGMQLLEVEATNATAASHSFMVQAAFLKAGKLIAVATGAINDLGAGQTKTASLLAQGPTAGYDKILMGVDTVVK